MFAWHEREGALERLTPPWDRVEVVERSGGISDGDRVVLRIGRRPLRARWVAEHYGYEAGRVFHDRQTSGPFSRWEHTHLVEPDGAEACWLTDRIEFELPCAALAGPLATPIVTATLERTFGYRHRTIGGDLAMHRAGNRGQVMNVLISGSSGLIGSALSSALTTGGHSVRRLVRSQPSGEAEFRWDPAAGRLDPDALEGVDAVVHLSGETVAGRWSESKKRRIMDSRVRSTSLLAEALAGSGGPGVLVCASAIGFYGDRGDQPLDESSAPGDGFLAEVVQAWEAATAPAAEAGVRVVNTRFGIVLSPAGGLLGQVLTPFKLGLGGPLGSGGQYMSWVAIDDVVGAIVQSLTHDQLSGPVNVTAPQPVTNAEFTKALGRVLHRPTFMKVPAFALKAAVGEFSGEALGSQRVLPARLIEDGYSFRFPEIEGALRHLLGRTG